LFKSLENPPRYSQKLFLWYQRKSKGSPKEQKLEKKVQKHSEHSPMLGV